jgi:hypothetical protein
VTPQDSCAFSWVLAEKKDVKTFNYSDRIKKPKKTDTHGVQSTMKKILP